MCNDASCLHRTKNFGHFGRSFPGTHSTMIMIRRGGGGDGGKEFPDHKHPETVTITVYQMHARIPYKTSNVAYDEIVC